MKAKNIFSIILLKFLFVGTALSCCSDVNYSLIEVLNEQERKWSAFLVYVDSTVLNHDYSFKSHGRMIENYQGVYHPTVEIYTGGNTSAGGFALEENKTYLIVSIDSGNGEYFAFVCDVLSRKMSGNNDSLSIVQAMNKYRQHSQEKKCGRVEYSKQNTLMAEGSLEDGLPNGKWTYYFYDGTRMSEVHYQKGKRKAKGKQFDQQGRLKSRTCYKKGWTVETRYNTLTKKIVAEYHTKPVGKSYTISKYLKYFDNGKVKHKFTEHLGPVYIRYPYHGDYEEYAENGELLAKGKYSQGAKVGQWLERKSVGLELIATEYPDFHSPATGLFRWFHPNGQLAVLGKLDDNGKQGQWTGFSEKGDTTFHGRYVNDERDGPWKEYHRDSGHLKSKGIYIEGERDGYWVQYLHNSSSINFHGNYKMGIQVGEWVSYFSNGNIQRVSNHNNNGKYDGEYKIYFKNGELQRTMEYVNGILQGWFVDYFENGKVKQQGDYCNGFKCGEWTTFDAAGNLICKCFQEIPTVENMGWNTCACL